MRAPSALAIAMAGMALLAALFFRHMPYPYDDVVAVEIPPERIALMPGGANGSRIPPPFQGPYAPNKRLKGAIRLFEKEVVGSECVAVTAQGDLIMLDQQGYVFRASPVKGSLTYQMTGQRFYVGPGRPLGFHVSGKWLYVCCSLKGLLRLHLDTGAIEILSNAVHNPVMGGGASHLLRPVTYANDLDVAADGSVYFTSSASRTITHTTKGDFYDTMRGYLLSNAYGEADGRLLVFHPASRRTTLVLDGLAFPNGVALSKDESWIAVVETSYARVLRHWLKGPRAGETEVLLDGLPGFPDGISRAPDGGFWLGLVARLSPLPRLLGRHRWLRHAVSHILQTLLPFIAKPWGAVVKLDAAGVPIKTLYDMQGSHVSSVSAATEGPGGRLFLGNLQGRGVSMIQV